MKRVLLTQKGVSFIRQRALQNFHVTKQPSTVPGARSHLCSLRGVVHDPEGGCPCAEAKLFLHRMAQGPYFPRYAADNVRSLEKLQGLHHQHVGVSAQIHQTVLAIHYHAVGGGP